jgi:Raf kinase inhibitor-like YbhB/YbcL family protein
MQLTSPAFGPFQAIHARYTCEGDETSPPLEWTDVPEGTRSFALVVDDPDAPDPAAPKRVWVHWVVYNIAASARELVEGASADALPEGTKVGRNDWGRLEYGGPCPPIGRHRYFHKLYALDVELDRLEAPGKSELLEAMRGHVLAQAELVGTYEKHR